MPPETLETLVAFFKALADLSRLRILGLVAEQERSVDELATILDLKAPTVSHHLKRLRALSLVNVRAAGNVRYYALNPEGLRGLNKSVFRSEKLVQMTDDLPVDRFERKVLESFVVDGRLTAIPARRKKRNVILRYLVERFEPGREYSEREVNDILQELHWDSATLRRELIGVKLMARNRGIYRRTEL